MMLVCAGIIMAGCASLSPSRSLPSDQQSPIYQAPTRVSASPTIAITAEEISSATPEPTQLPNCTNGLKYINDLSIPDGTQLNPNTEFEKKWQVKNTGTCNWNRNYTLRLVSGSPMGVDNAQPLEAVLNGTEAVLLIKFISPEEPGKYQATWRVYDPDGIAFGEWLTLDIGVTTP